MREGGLAEVNPGLSQNPLNHSFMSASLFNESQQRFLVRQRLEGEASCAGISRKRREVNGFNCAVEKLC